MNSPDAPTPEHSPADDRTPTNQHADIPDATVVRRLHGAGHPAAVPGVQRGTPAELVLFGERLPARQLATYQAEIPPGFDLVFSVGTTSVFPYISAPVLDAYHFRKPSVEINPGETDVSEFVTVKLPLGAASALDAVWREYNR